MSRLTLVLAGLLLAGCRSFMGAPEWRSVKMEETYPDTALRGVTRMTAVRRVEYAEYARHMRQGRVIARERMGKDIYFAIESPRSVTFTPAGSDQPVTAVVAVIERYKAKAPPQPTPVFPSDDRWTKDRPSARKTRERPNSDKPLKAPEPPKLDR